VLFAYWGAAPSRALVRELADEDVALLALVEKFASGRIFLFGEEAARICSFCWAEFDLTQGNEHSVRGKKSEYNCQ